EDRAHFDRVCKALTAAGVPYVINDRLVRGLDYYGRTVFEWTTTQLGAQGTVCGGGRYDGLVAHLGGKATPGVGFAIGVERLVLLLETLDAFPADLERGCEVYLMLQSPEAEPALRRLASQIREAAPELRVMTHIGEGSLKSQLKRADKSGALVGLILGEDELRTGQVQVKPLRGGETQTVDYADAVAYCQRLRKAQWII
ncbi:MAG: histidine--tRNA ligase, partial [Litorivicinaceae bacterium]